MNKTVAKKILYETLGDTGTKAQTYFSRVRRAVITNASSLLTWTKMYLNVGFVIIMVATLGVLLDVLVRMSQLQKWDQITDRTDLSRFADLFSEEVVGEIEEKVELPPEFVSLANKNLPLSANRALRYLQERGYQEQIFNAGRLAFVMMASMAAESLCRRLGQAVIPTTLLLGLMSGIE